MMSNEDKKQNGEEVNGGGIQGRREMDEIPFIWITL